tara:strand:+ start:112 stop:369 length:258 start_codon:yes stop_codon:yes gene_type:complete
MDPHILSLESKAMISPSQSIWRVTFVFEDGSKRKVCVSPGRIGEAEAVKRAKGHAKIFDDRILREIQTERVDRQAAMSRFGEIQK